MKLKLYTDKETNKLLSDISETIDLVFKLSLPAIDIIEEKYKEYLNNFKVSLFRWKPLGLNNFTYEIFGGGIRTIDEWDIQHYSTLKQVPVGTKYIYSITWHGNYDFSILKKYKIKPFSTKEIQLISDVSSFKQELTSDTVYEKYKVLLNYADRPFQFDESDVQFLEKVKYLVTRVGEYK